MHTYTQPAPLNAECSSKNTGIRFPCTSTFQQKPLLCCCFRLLCSSGALQMIPWNHFQALHGGACLSLTLLDIFSCNICSSSPVTLSPQEVSSFLKQPCPFFPGDSCTSVCCPACLLDAPLFASNSKIFTFSMKHLASRLILSHETKLQCVTEILCLLPPPPPPHPIVSLLTVWRMQAFFWARSLLCGTSIPVNAQCHCQSIQ